MERFLKSGCGWRLGWRPDAPVFQGLVGGNDWAIELTAAEFEDFCRLARQLAQTLQQMAQELMDEERIACEAESEWLWLEAEGYPQAFSLRLIVLTGRQAEGNWPDTATPELIRTLDVLQFF